MAVPGPDLELGDTLAGRLAVVFADPIAVGDPRHAAEPFRKPGRQPQTGAFGQRRLSTCREPVSISGREDLRAVREPEAHHGPCRPERIRRTTNRGAA